MSVLAIVSIAFSAFIGVVEAQRRVPGQAESKQAVAVALKAGGQTYESREAGKCTHAPTASIYSIVSEMWSVQQSSDGRSLALTVWRPKDGSGEMVTLSVSSGNSSHQVNTVRGGEG
jgi:hypothetical protein